MISKTFYNTYKLIWSSIMKYSMVPKYHPLTIALASPVSLQLACQEIVKSRNIFYNERLTPQIYILFVVSNLISIDIHPTTPTSLCGQSFQHIFITRVGCIQCRMKIGVSIYYFKVLGLINFSQICFADEIIWFAQWLLLSSLCVVVVHSFKTNTSFYHADYVRY